MWIDAAEDGFHFVTGRVPRPPRPKPMHQTACNKLYSPIQVHEQLPEDGKPCAECAAAPRVQQWFADRAAEASAKAAEAAEKAVAEAATLFAEGPNESAETALETVPAPAPAPEPEPAPNDVPVLPASPTT